MEWTTVIAQRPLGIVIMVLFAVQGVFTVFSSGSLRFQRPEGGLVVWVYNIVNLTTILVLTPAAALCLMRGWGAPLRWTGIPLGSGVVIQIMGGVGLAMFVLGNGLIYWSRVVLGGSFRLGAVPPGDEDRLIVNGPFAWIRHPMYSAVLLMSVGLGLALRSVPFLAAFLLLAITIPRLIPVEEAQLRQAYGEEYATYTKRTRRLFPLVY